MPAMTIKDLIAPESYNLTREIERYDSDKIAIRWEDEAGRKKTMTYHQLIAAGNRFANVLTDLGIGKGDRIMVIVPRILEAYIIYFGALKAGAAVIPGSEMLRAEDIAFRLNQGEAAAVLVYTQYTEQVDRIREATPALRAKIAVGGDVPGWLSMNQLMRDASPSFIGPETSKDDMALLTYTSGTSGTPKGVVHSHSWAYAHLRIAADRWLDIHQDDTVWATAGPGWQMWVWSPFLSVLGKGATGLSYFGRFHPEKQLQLLQEYKVSVLCCTPTEYRAMAKVDHLDRFDLSQLRVAASAGEALNIGVIETFKKTFGIQLRDGYGQTESTLLIGTTNGTAIRQGSMGKPTFDAFITIVDENGVPVPDQTEGNIAVRRDFPALFCTYFKQPERYREAIRGDYFLTGDRAVRDRDGYFWFRGRRDDVIISSGYTIGPVEVEDTLLKHEAVKDCAVVASPHPIRGNIVKAFIVLKDGIEGSPSLVHELQSFVKKETAPYKYPRAIEFVRELPKTVSGKIMRSTLRELELRRYREKKRVASKE